MENKPSIDIGLLGPLILGGLSLAGILLIFFSGVAAPRATVEAGDTPTPFRYIYLGTEPGLSTLTPEPTATDAPNFPRPSFATATLSLTSPAFPTEAVGPTSTLKPTATVTLSAVLVKYDDTDPQILYDGDWTSYSTEPGTYQKTLHVSFETENYALFSFVGEQIIVTYQSGPGLGEMLIDIDGFQFIVSQSDIQIKLVPWSSPPLLKIGHDVIIEHYSGGSINIDSITIPALSTPVP